MAAPLSSAATPAEEGPWATPRAQALPTARTVMARIYGADGKPKPYAENKARTRTARMFASFEPTACGVRRAQLRA